jgi:hypothetical protein
MLLFLLALVAPLSIGFVAYDAFTDDDDTDDNTDTSDEVDLGDAEPMSLDLIGDDGPNVLEGGPGDDTLSGLDGEDELRGRAGNDVLSGGLGEDSIFGGPGDDLLEGEGDFRGGRGMTDCSRSQMFVLQASIQQPKALSSLVALAMI